MARGTESRLSAYAQERFESVDDAMAALAEATAIVNEELGEGKRSGVYPRADTRKRLSRHISLLGDLAASIARQFGAASYTISVGLPAGVSVGITWEKSR
jgi:hypothetical protein